MAVRDDFAAGEVLAAADLNDTFAAKPTFTYGTATPTADADGAIWYDENDTPPTPKFWDGSAWQPFSSGTPAAVVSSPSATGNYTDGNGVNWNYYRFTASSSITFSSAGLADILLVGGGAGPSSTNWRGSGGCALFGTYLVSAATQTITIGAGGSSGGPVPGGATSVGSLTTGRAGQYEITFTGPIGPGTGTNGSISNDYTGSAVTYGQGGQGPGTANSGNGGGTGTAGAAGICVVRVRTN